MTSTTARSGNRSEEALRALAAELGIEDRVQSSAYVKRFHREIARAAWRPVTGGALVRAARRADLVLLGEFHPLPGATESARELLAELSPGRRPLRVGLEMVHARDQLALDAYAAGRIGRREFARRIRYVEEWGYPLAGVFDLLDAARAKRVDVRGLDIPPRGDAADLRLRDVVAAERIAAGWDAERGTRSRWLVVYGEAHAAAGHLPARVAERVPREPRIVRVLHDVALPGDPAGGLHGSGDGLFARQRVGHAGRARALARVWRRWASENADPHELDLSLLVHELIDGIALRIGVRPRRHRIAPGVRLADLYPEVFGPGEASRARRRLREAGFGRAVTDTLFVAASRRGALLADGADVIVAAAPDMTALALASGGFLARTLVRTSSGLAASHPETPPAARAGRSRGGMGDEAGERVALVAFATVLACLADPTIPLAGAGSGAPGRLRLDPAAWTASAGACSRLVEGRPPLIELSGDEADGELARAAAVRIASRLVDGIAAATITPRDVGRALVARRRGGAGARLARLVAQT